MRIGSELHLEIGKWYLRHRRDGRSSAVAHCPGRVRHVCAVWRTGAAPCAPHPSVSDSNESAATERTVFEFPDRQRQRQRQAERGLDTETDKSYVQVDAPVGRRKVTCTGSLLKVIFPRTQLTRRLFVYSTRCCLLPAANSSGQWAGPTTADRDRANGSQCCPSTAPNPSPSPSPAASRLCCMQIFGCLLFSAVASASSTI